ncbi:PQQ-dependent sugar dehydrogenase [Anianabacter salinae]|uniref:PQQ-dependent sugar dehydrogenase n=1 Tax=Anianabacter salinae TaxID=2851023 RepID=UPI00225E4548|nr:PQQ-dependent sugar dehydrogenase [Anianabacter salinae]MBV0913595.1 PQQ-dependent sugar dehydrogenase [Anianabacter salinae]
MTRQTSLFAGALFSLIAAPAVAQDPVEQGAPNAGFEPAFENQTRAPAMDSGVTLTASEFSGELVHPWGIDALPNGGWLVTERPGRMRVMSEDGTLSDPIEGLPEVLAERQGGLLDVKVGPDFAEDRMIYWTYAKPMENGESATAAARGVLSEDRTEVTEVEDIFVQSPSSPSPMHYGSRIVFDGEGHAFITTGEHFTQEEREFAQDLDTTYGKVVRVALDGTVPEGNPYTGEARSDAARQVWSYGHRNVQGAAIHPETGQLWTIEHGPAGGDELNRIEPGTNYGWPVISYGVNYNGNEVGTGDAVQDGMAQPRYYWDPVIAPGDMVFYDGEMFGDWQGDLLIASLSPGGIVRLSLDGDTVTGEERFMMGERRIRDIAVAPDGALLALWDDPNGAVLRMTPEEMSN